MFVIPLLASINSAVDICVFAPFVFVKPGTIKPRPGEGDKEGLRDIVLRLFLFFEGGVLEPGAGGGVLWLAPAPSET